MATQDDETQPEDNVVQLASHRVKAPSEKILRQKWRAGLDPGFTVVPAVLIRSLPGLRIGATELSVLVCLIDAWWAPGDMPWPSKAKLAAMLNLSEKTIQRTLKKLAEQGLIVSEARFRKHRGQTSNRYDLSPLVDRLEAIVVNLKKAEAEATTIRRRAIARSSPQRAKSKAAKA